MKFLQQKYEALITILRQAYFEREHAVVGEQWKVNAMHCIRGLGPLETRTSFIMFFEGFVWRLTPVTCALILVFAVLLFVLDFTPQYEVFTSLIYDTEEAALVRLFGF